MQVGPSLGPSLGPTLEALDAARAPTRPPPRREANASDRTETFTVKLGSWTYPLAWVGIYAIHTACAVHCFGAAMLFHRIKTSRTAYYLDFYKVTLPSKHADTVALVHYIVGGVHCWYLALALVRAVYRFVCATSKRCRRGAVVQPKHRTSSSFLDRVASAGSQSIERHVPLLLRRPVMAVYKHVFGRHGVLGVEYRYFDAFFLVREVTETALQSLQAYQMCRLLGRPALNRFFVATLIINCWATPVLHHLVASKPMQRLLTRLCDVVLDFLASVGVPVILTLSYFGDYDPVTRDFPYRLWYDDVWFVNVLKESPLILFSSWLDAVSRLVFSIGVLSSLDDIKILLKRGPGFQFGKAASSLRRMSTAKRSIKKQSRVVSSATSPPSWTKPQRSRLVTLAHRLMFGFGVAVLGVHLYAELRPSPMSSCLLEVRPWLVSKPACSLVEVNCWRDRSLTGNAANFQDNVGELDALSLTQITFRHCRQVEIQPSIQRFHNMIGIKFYNSTIASWGEQAAFEEAHHASMRFAFFVRTTFANATLPPGMISHEFPLHLNDLEFSVTNLNWIPDDLDERWPPGVALCLEFSELTSYPMTFARAQFQSITLMGNKITHFPAAAFEATGPFMIAVTGNPITELPADVNASRVTLRRFQIELTNVSTMPPWVREWIERAITRHRVTAGSTPWCRDVVLQASASDLAQQPWLSRINCQDLGPTYGVYPHYVDERADEVW